jgi:hypothetical protein
LDKLIKLSDCMALRNPELTKTQRTRATEAQAARAEYSTQEVKPEDQLPPKGFPRCLVREDYLKELGELEVDALELSEKYIELDSLNALLEKKLGKGDRMVVSGS